MTRPRVRCEERAGAPGACCTDWPAARLQPRPLNPLACPLSLVQAVMGTHNAPLTGHLRVVRSLTGRLDTSAYRTLGLSRCLPPPPLQTLPPGDAPPGEHAASVTYNRRRSGLVLTFATAAMTSVWHDKHVSACWGHADLSKRLWFVRN